MPTNSDLTIQQYEVHPKLGRHLVLDPRSLAYQRPYDGETIKPVEWAPKVPVLDQEDLLAQGIRTSQIVPGADDVDALGSCTANAATAVVSVLQDADSLQKAGLDVTDAVAAEKWAIGLYHDATLQDEWLEQQWPVDDCGSSGLGVVKALKSRGLIDQFSVATTAEEVARDFAAGAELWGVPWFQAWFEPTTSSALLDDIKGWERSGVAGGHEIAAIALEDVKFDKTDRLDLKRTIVRFRNSWTTSYGDEGCFRMSFALYQKIRAQVDVKQPRLDIASTR
ncbi:hypothetical protein [Streptomyces sp. 8L]|uniref:hypothetical protein n=1 Tax=Streptomyces sp. 8L TaxID=2877242 RepID=UPI001CD1EE3C|nr:hypothetical protein [Streptomyces sp. 8L]MCA1220243.1 hypothetical protein [Streptomyces sp. 8L]